MLFVVGTCTHKIEVVITLTVQIKKIDYGVSNICAIKLFFTTCVYLSNYFNILYFLKLTDNNLAVYLFSIL